MHWFYLSLAALFEITWVIAMKYSHGFSAMIPSAIAAIGSILSVVFLSMAVRQLPMSTAYALWTGTGIAGTAIAGVFLFNERLTFPQIICIGLIACGIIGLKLLVRE